MTLAEKILINDINKKITNTRRCNYQNKHPIMNKIAFNLGTDLIDVFNNWKILTIYNGCSDYCLQQWNSKSSNLTTTIGLV